MSDDTDRIDDDAAPGSPDDGDSRFGFDSPTAATARVLARARRIGGAVPAPAPRPAPAPDDTRELRAEAPSDADPDAEPDAEPQPEPPPPGPEDFSVVPEATADTSDAGPGDEPAPATSRAGRNLPAAIAVGLGLGALIVASLFVYRPSFAVIVGLAVVYATWELCRAIGTSGVHPSLPPLLVGAVASLVAAWERGPDGLVVGVLLTVVAVLVWRVGDGADGYLQDAGASLFVLLYVPLLAGFAVLLAHPDDGAARVLAFVGTVVCSDTGGYATGVLFGKHPLAPIVSKAKTWEGFAGSVVACSTAGILLLTLTFHEAWWKGLLFGLAVVVTATVGDLGESLIKRDLGIKDMGTVLPGHGGIMDRLDSLLPCAAVAFLLLSAFAPV